MGFQYFKRAIQSIEGGAVQAVTSTGTTVSPFGLSRIDFSASTGDKIFPLARPGTPGMTKYIVCDTTGVQKVTCTVNGSTGTGFFVNGGGNAGGSTYRSIVFSSQSTKVRSVGLYGVTADTWAIISKSTGTTLAG